MRDMVKEETKFLQSIEVADLAVCDSADSFLQSAMWGRFKARFEWEAKAFLVEWDGVGARPLLTLTRRIAPGITMTYIPWGPELPEGTQMSPNVATELARALRPLLPHVTFIRFDFPWFAEDADAPPQFPKAAMPPPFKRAAADIQPPDTVLVDLTPPPADILAAMKPKWRYNIGLAEKHGVTVTRRDEQGIDIFYSLLAETAERDGLAVHSIEYYRALFEECRNAESCGLRLYTAEHEGETIAAIVVLFRGKQATYLYGASANVKRNLMAPYALQWKAMQDARAYGCGEYDLFGIPPNDDPHHPMAGLYRFKTGFGGRIVHRPGSWDYPCKPARYALFSGAERLRKKIRDRRKRQPP